MKAAFLAFGLFCFTLGLSIGWLPKDTPKPVSYLDQRNACIDMFAHSHSWRQTLCKEIRR